MGSDMSDDFRAWNEERKLAKHRNWTDFQKTHIMMFQLTEGFRKCSDYHYQMTLNGEVINYWPSTRKWMYQGQKYTGLPTDLLNFIRNRVKVSGTTATMVIVDEVHVSDTFKDRKTPNDEKLRLIAESMNNPEPPWDPDT